MMKLKNPNKMMWILLIVFLLTFCFGDLISTALVLQFKPVVTIPTKCVCKLPPECDVNPAVQKNISMGFLFAIKLVIVLIFLLLMLFIRREWVGYVMLTLSLLGFFAVLSNLTIYYWKLAPLFFYAIAAFSVLTLYYFTKPKWQKKK